MEIYMHELSKRYGKKSVVQHLTWEVGLGEGQIYGMIGPNGAGKTTLLKMITGILKYDSGFIELCGSANGSYENWCRANIAFIPSGDRGLRIKNTVYENVLYYGLLKGNPKKNIEHHIEKYSASFHMEQILHKRAEELSMGQKKKTFLLSGLCSGKTVMILDEPSVGLDLEAQKELKDLLLQLSKELKTTIILSSHDVDFLSPIVSHHVFLYSGRIVKQIHGAVDSGQLKNKYFSLLERQDDYEITG